ncbi:HD domain-containing protein [Parendozoicomonas sp. Alg238-R29]|uniref:HD domain-containing protein n=1 Tax=Parendozoicomonas sp. Alg238-R29 TaxID=2993446 RepID=UPI00248F366A|nr:HD domain-containing protein [Parendozoicomonas sp. Alg238-R29]
MEQLSQQMAFILELDKLKAVYRQTTVKDDNNRHENSAEHSWHIATMAHVLYAYASEPVDIHRVTMMLLIHDIVEIDAGDTFAFATQQVLDGQEKKELKAVDRLFGLLPENQCQQMKALWLEFEHAQTADSRFAKAMDRILPLLQNMANNGGSWTKHNIRKSQAVERNRYLETAAPHLWKYALEQIELAAEKGWLLEG